MALAGRIDALLDRVVHQRLGSDADVLRQAKRVAAFDFAFLFWVLVFAALYAALGAPLCGLVTLWAALPILASLAAVARGRSPVLAGNLLCAAGLVTLTALGLVTGGWTGIPPMLWYTVLPVVAVLTCGIGWGIAWTVAALASIAAFALLPALGLELPQALGPQSAELFGFAAVAGLLVCQFVLAWVRVGVEQRALEALAEAQRKLASARADAETLEATFGLSLDEWERLKREKAALEYFIERRFGKLETSDELADCERLPDSSASHATAG
jgi:hypothetical protein